MKKRAMFGLILAVMAVCVAIGAIGAMSDVALAEGNSAEELLPEDTAIVVAEGKEDEVMHGAEVLQDYIWEITGVKPEIKSDAEAQSGFEICLGETNRTETVLGNASVGSYVMKSFENGLEMIGKGKRGTIYAVYEFLRRFGGCEWYTSTLIVKGDCIVKPEGVDVSYEPYFEYTDTDWVSPRNAVYSVAHGLTGGSSRQISEEEGGVVNYVSGFCHTLSIEFCAAGTYFEEHPEYFALRGGERVGKQLCLTNPDVLAIVTQEVLDLLADTWDPGAALQIVSLTQADNEEYCECENCKRLDEANGAHSGTMITFVNSVATAVKEAGYDNVAIDTFAYRYTRACPTEVKPLDNVIVRLCTIECCFTHALDDAGCEDNVELMKDLSDWGKICNRIYVWDYATNYAHTCGPFPDFGVIQRNVQVFYENNVKGVYEEGNYYMAYCNTEFGELRSYLLSVLLQNPYCDYDAEMNKFLNAYYGEEAVQYIRSYIDITTENAAKQHADIYCELYKTFSFTDEEIEKIDGLWDGAIATYAGKTDEASKMYLANIERSEISWLMYKADAEKGEFAGCGRFAARKELIDRLNASGATMLQEGNTTGELAEMMCLLPVGLWVQDQSVVSYFIGAVLACILILVMALATSIVAIRKKRPLVATAFPWVIGTMVLFFWALSVFIAWESMFLYACSCILIAVAMGYLAFVMFRTLQPRKRLYSACLCGGINGIFSGAVLQTGILSLIHTIVFAFRQNYKSFCIILIIQCVYILCMLVAMLVAMSRKRRR